MLKFFKRIIFKDMFLKTAKIKDNSIKDELSLINSLNKYYSNNNAKIDNDKKICSMNLNINASFNSWTPISTIFPVLLTLVAFVSSFAMNDVQERLKVYEQNISSLKTKISDNKKEIVKNEFRKNNNNLLSDYEKRELDFTISELKNQNKTLSEDIAHAEEKLNRMSSLLDSLVEPKFTFTNISLLNVYRILIIGLMFIYLIDLIFHTRLTYRKMYYYLCLSVIEEIDKKNEQNNQANQIKNTITEVNKNLELTCLNLKDIDTKVNSIKEKYNK